MSVLFLGLFGSCDNSEKTTNSNTCPFGVENQYNKEEKCIIKRERLDYDIKAIVGLDVQSGDVAIMFEIFNYGEDLCINNFCERDRFSDALAQNYMYYVPQINEVQISTTKNDKNYGNWAIANVYCYSHLFRGVIVSPLAYSFLQNPNDDDTLVFVNLNTRNRYKNILLLGSYIDKHIINSHYDKIQLNKSVSFSAGADWDLIN